MFECRLSLRDLICDGDSRSAFDMTGMTLVISASRLMLRMSDETVSIRKLVGVLLTYQMGDELSDIK
jgi:hypothetical protein